MIVAKQTNVLKFCGFYAELWKDEGFALKKQTFSLLIFFWHDWGFVLRAAYLFLYLIIF